MSTADPTPDWLTPAPRRRRIREFASARGTNVQRPSALEVVGELLLAAGLLVLLFVAYLMVWTDVAANATHERLIEDITWATEPLPAAPTEAPTTVPEVDPTAHLFEQGTTIAVLRVPRFGADYVQPISEGTDKRTILDVLGIGHYPDSAQPGQVGNFALAAHRTTYGKPFNRAGELVEGDELIVDTPEARFVYKVTSHEIVTPDRIDVIAPEPGEPGVEPTNRWITLTTCHPMFSARQRLIVHGVLDSWTPKEITH